MLIDRRFVFLTLFALLVVACALSSGAAATERPRFDTWLDGHEGMLEAMRQHEERGRPILVYFYTDWCPYCRQFENELLSEDYVEEYLEGVIKVRINPEKGAAESMISRHYGIRGFPALFVHSGRSKVVSTVDRLAVENGQPRLLEAEEFVDVLREAAER
jgi:thiol-disulfide isomerase/thioredoxin